MKESQQRPIQRYILAGVLILLLLAVFRLFAPFFTPLLWSIFLYIIFSPLHRHVTKSIDQGKLKGKILLKIWAGIFTLGTFVLIILPVLFVSRLFYLQVQELGRDLLNFIQERPDFAQELLDKVLGFIVSISSDRFVITADDIEEQIRVFIINITKNMISHGSNIFQNVGSFLLNILIMAFSLFFFYIDGSYLSRLVWKAVPIKTEYIISLINKLKNLTRNLFLGYVIIALLQSVVAFIIFTIFKINGSLVLSAITFLLVFIPMFGAAIIYIPITVIFIFNGEIVTGIIFLVISVVFLSGIDNVLRPFLLKDRIQLHPLIIFFAILGGIFAFGFNGFILGPAFVILFLTVLDQFLTEYKITGIEGQDKGQTD